MNHRQQVQQEANEKQEKAKQVILQALATLPTTFRLMRYPTSVFRVKQRTFDLRPDGLYVFIERQRNRQWEDYMTLSMKQLLEELVEIA